MNLNSVKKALLQIILEAKMTSKSELARIPSSGVLVKRGREQDFINLAVWYYKLVKGKDLNYLNADFKTFIDDVYRDLLKISKKEIERSNLYNAITVRMKEIIEDSEAIDFDAISKRLSDILDESKEAQVIVQQMTILLDSIKQKELLLEAKKKATIEGLRSVTDRLDVILSESLEYDDSVFRNRIEEILLDSKRARKVASDGKKVKAALVPEYEELLTKICVPTSDFKMVKSSLLDEYERLLNIYNSYSIFGYKQEENDIEVSRAEYQKLSKKLETQFKNSSDSKTVKVDYFDEYERLLKQSKQKLVLTSDGKRVNDSYKDEYEELLYAQDLFRDAQDYDNITRVYEIINETIKKEKDSVSYDRLDEQLIKRAKSFYDGSDKRREELKEYRRILGRMRMKAYPRLDDFIPSPNVIYLGGTIAEDNVKEKVSVSSAEVSGVEIASEVVQSSIVVSKEDSEAVILDGKSDSEFPKDVLGENNGLTLEHITGVIEDHDEVASIINNGNSEVPTRNIEVVAEETIGSEEEVSAPHIDLEPLESTQVESAVLNDTSQAIDTPEVGGISFETNSEESSLTMEELLAQFETIKSTLNPEPLEENKIFISQLRERIAECQNEKDASDYNFIICLYENLIDILESARLEDDLDTLDNGTKIRHSDYDDYNNTFQMLIDEFRKLQDNDSNKPKKKNRRLAVKPKKEKGKKKKPIFGKKSGGKREKKSFASLLSNKFNEINKIFSNMFKTKTARLVFTSTVALTFAVPVAIAAVFGHFKSTKNNNSKTAEPKVNTISTKDYSRINTSSTMSLFVPADDLNFMNGVATAENFYNVGEQSIEGDLDFDFEPEPVDPRVDSIARAAEGPDDYFYALSIEEKIEYVKEAFSITYAEFNDICYNKRENDLYNILKPYRDAINNEMIPIILENEGLTANQLDIVASTVNHECGGGTYEDAYGVSSTFLNRINDVYYVRSHGTSVYSQCIARDPDQFDSYCRGFYKKFLGVESEAKQAFYDAMYSKTTIHDWKGFRSWGTTSYSDNYIIAGGNRYSEIFSRLNEYTDEDKIKDDYFKTLFDLYPIIDNIHYARSR